ncbi:MAG: LacI family DNA-binding transcriptional regulator [Phycisphaerae bacterium]
MSSVRRIAARAGVSIATVSRVLNNSPAVSVPTREAVLSVANRVGYVKGRLRRAGSASIGFVHTAVRTISHAFDAAVLEGIVRGAEEARHDVLIISLHRDKSPDETHAQFFGRKGVSGVILRTTAATRDICREIAGEGFPHVVLSEQFDEPYVSYLDGASGPESQRAVEYLIALGHRRIGFAMHNVPDRDHLDRLEGYRHALRAAGIQLDERLVFRQPAKLAGGATVLTMAMNMPDRPTALFSADPALAIGLIKKAHELGVRVPQDLSIIGFDDTDLRFSVHPTLTAVCQDASALGYEAARWITRGAVRESLRKTIPTFFEVNGSTAPPCATNGASAAS